MLVSIIVIMVVGVAAYLFGRSVQRFLVGERAAMQANVERLVHERHIDREAHQAASRALCLELERVNAQLGALLAEALHLPAPVHAVSPAHGASGSRGRPAGPAGPPPAT